jgi:hypothetical protein
LSAIFVELGLDDFVEVRVGLGAAGEGRFRGGIGLERVFEQLV